MLSLSASAKLEAYWAQLRLVHADVIGLKIVKQVAEPLRQQGGNHSSQIKPIILGPSLLDGVVRETWVAAGQSGPLAYLDDNAPRSATSRRAPRSSAWR